MRSLTFMVVLLIAVSGGAIFIFLNPSPPALRSEIKMPTAPIDERTGVYADEENRLWLVAPAIVNGRLVKTRVDRWKGSSTVTSRDLWSSDFTKLPDQPYTIKTVGLQTDVDLEGWLFAPGGNPDAAVVILHGSGDSDRDNSWYRYLAHRLAVSNIAVLLPDKRGSGRSAGDWRNASFELLAEDGAAWYGILEARYPDVPGGFFGVSQGGFVAPLAARKVDADFAVAQSASATVLTRQLEAEIANDVRAAGVPGFLESAVTRLFVLRAKRRQPEFWKKMVPLTW